MLRLFFFNQEKRQCIFHNRSLSSRWSFSSLCCLESQQNTSCSAQIQHLIQQPLLPVSAIRQLLNLLPLKRPQPCGILRGAICCLKILCQGLRREQCHQCPEAVNLIWPSYMGQREMFLYRLHGERVYVKKR